jgi:DnaJ-class molecular chaperone
MWPFKIKVRCPSCTGSGKARFVAYTVTREVPCVDCSGTGELHKVDDIREDVVNTFGHKIGTRSVGKRSRIDPCPACEARGRVRRTERCRAKLHSGCRSPQQGEVYEADCEVCAGRGLLVEGVGPYVRCRHCLGLGFQWPALVTCWHCRGKGLLENGWTIYNIDL